MLQDESFYRQVLQLREGELLRETGKLSQRKGIGKIKETLRHSSAQVLFACFCFVFFNVQPRRVANFFCSLSGRFKERTVYLYSLCGVSPVARGIESACQCRRREFVPWVGKIPWRREWRPTLYSCLRNPVDRGAHGLQSMTLPRVRHDLATEERQCFLCT